MSSFEAFKLTIVEMKFKMLLIKLNPTSVPGDIFSSIVLEIFK